MRPHTPCGIRKLQQSVSRPTLINSKLGQQRQFFRSPTRINCLTRRIPFRSKKEKIGQEARIEILLNESAYMGWSKEDRIGKVFAEIAPNDVLLIAYGPMINHGASRV
jgi:hypothetical protein